MAIPKTLGIETEYGIVHRGVDEANPITASSLLINAYLSAEGYRTDERSDLIAWDFIDESPDLDARGFSPMGALPPEVETHLVNAFGSHASVSTYWCNACRSPFELLKWRGPAKGS